MKEAYVSYEVAKLLKEKGFDWECAKYYNAQHDEARIVGDTFICNWNDESLIKRLMMSGAYSIPTQQMACRWLREEHEIDIIPIIRHSLKYAQESPFRDYACRVYDCDGNIVLSATKWYSRYENAVEAALQYCLTNLI